MTSSASVHNQPRTTNPAPAQASYRHDLVSSEGPEIDTGTPDPVPRRQHAASDTTPRNDSLGYFPSLLPNQNDFSHFRLYVDRRTMPNLLPIVARTRLVDTSYPSRVVLRDVRTPTETLIGGYFDTPSIEDLVKIGLYDRVPGEESRTGNVDSDESIPALVEDDEDEPARVAYNGTGSRRSSHPIPSADVHQQGYVTRARTRLPYTL